MSETSSKIRKALPIIVLVFVIVVCVRTIIGFTFLDQYEDLSWKGQAGVIFIGIFAVHFLIENIKRLRSENNDER